jgi:hypothetical protein
MYTVEHNTFIIVQTQYTGDMFSIRNCLAPCVLHLMLTLTCIRNFLANTELCITKQLILTYISQNHFEAHSPKSHNAAIILVMSVRRPVIQTPLARLSTTRRILEKFDVVFFYYNRYRNSKFG